MSPHKTEKDPGTETTITSHSKVPLSVLWAAICLTVLGTLGYFKIMSKLEKLERHMTGDWTIIEQRMWATEVSSLNTNVVVPDPDSILHKSRIWQ